MKSHKLVQVDVTLCDGCHEEIEGAFNKVVIAWAKNGEGTNSDAYELCDPCWCEFQRVRDGWLLAQHTDGKEVTVDYLEVPKSKDLREMNNSFKNYDTHLRPLPKMDHNIDASTWK